MKSLTTGHHFTVYETLASPAAVVSLFNKGLLCTKHQAHLPICLVKSTQYPSKVDIIMTLILQLRKLRLTRPGPLAKCT